MVSFEEIKNLVVKEFSHIVLALGLLLLVANTLDINASRNPKNSKDKLNEYYGLNVASIVFFSLFLAKEYVLPLLTQTQAN
jgi:hypothetical protein